MIHAIANTPAHASNRFGKMQTIQREGSSITLRYPDTLPDPVKAILLNTLAATHMTRLTKAQAHQNITVLAKGKTLVAHISTNKHPDKITVKQAPTESAETFLKRTQEATLSGIKCAHSELPSQPKHLPSTQPQFKGIWAVVAKLLGKI